MLSIVHVAAIASLTAPRLSDRVFSPRLPSTKKAQQTSVCRVEKFLSDSEIDAIHAAAEKAPGLGSKQVSRSNGLEDDSWRTVFMNHRLASLLPDVTDRLLAAAKEADASMGWNVLDQDRQQVSLRCAEYHTVQAAGGLPQPKHFDAGSLITMDLMLSDPSSGFEGGTFQTLERDGSLLQHTFERGDLLLFVSHKYHSVSPVTSGTRQVLVMELWEGLERRCPRRCNSPWGPCSCRIEALYTRLDEGTRTDLAKVPFARNTPVAVKHGWSAMQKLRGAAPSSITTSSKVPLRASRIKMMAAPPNPPAPPPAPPAPPSAPLLVADCAALALYSLSVSSYKAFRVVAAELTSPDYDFAEDLTSFDLQATVQYIGVEQFCAASLALGWLLGGAVAGACSEAWRTTLDEEARWRTLVSGFLVAAPLAVLIKYGVLANYELPSLGRTVQAAELEALLAGFTPVNVLSDVVGMFATLVLWRRVLLLNPDLPL